MIDASRPAPDTSAFPSAAALTWWFEPWRYADHRWWNLGTVVDLPSGAHSIIAWRRAYRGWCERLGLPLCWDGPIDEAWCAIGRPANAVGALRLLGATVMAADTPARHPPPEMPHADKQWALQCALTGSLGKTANVDDSAFVALNAIQAAVRATSPCLISRLMLIFPPALLRGYNPDIEPVPSAVARRIRRVWAAACSRSEEA